jgi:hypothetical protein
VSLRLPCCTNVRQLSALRVDGAFFAAHLNKGKPSFIRVSVLDLSAHLPDQRSTRCGPRSEDLDGARVALLQDSGSEVFGQAEALQLLRGTDHQATQRLVVRLGRAEPQVGDARMIVGQGLECTVKAGPALGLNLGGQCKCDLAGGAGTEFQLDEMLGPFPEPAADVVARYDEIVPVLGLPPD